MTAVLSTHCRSCHRELTDAFSRKLGYGPECRKDLTPEQLADAIRANQPGYVPRAEAPRPASVQARINRADALAAVDEVVECGCGSGARAGRCPECRLEQTDPMKVLAIRVQRVIERVRAERTAERDARYEAWRAAYPAEPEQLTIYVPDHLREEAS